LSRSSLSSDPQCCNLDSFPKRLFPWKWYLDLSILLHQRVQLRHLLRWNPAGLDRMAHLRMGLVNLARLWGLQDVAVKATVCPSSRGALQPGYDGPVTATNIGRPATDDDGLTHGPATNDDGLTNGPITNDLQLSTLYPNFLKLASVLFLIYFCFSVKVLIWKKFYKKEKGSW